MPTERSYSDIGIAGVANLGVLTIINLWRMIRFLTKQDYQKGVNYNKKLAFHLFLLFATVVDIPLYAAFITEHEYTLTTYSFHKFSSAFLFAAFSITISDWSTVLYDINEYELRPFLLRKATLIGINVVYTLVSLTNFIFCYTLSDFDSYTNSSLYIMGIFFQILVSLVLTLFMLSAGLKLAWRIHGVSGGRDDLNRNPTPGTGLTTVQFQQFSSALWNLNIVMATCAFCIILQTVLLVADYAMGYANSTSKTVGPLMFYWVSYFWLPLWGVSCSLLYLSRTHSKRADVKNAPISAMTSSDPGFCNPLISSTDQDGHHYRFDNDDEAESGAQTSSSYAGSQRSDSNLRPTQSTGGVAPMGSFDSQDYAADGILRINSSTVFGSENGGVSGHTEQLFGNTDTEHDHMFGDVFSPDNSIGHGYRDSALFSPAQSMATPKEFKIPRS